MRDEAGGALVAEAGLGLEAGTGVRVALERVRRAGDAGDVGSARSCAPVQQYVPNIKRHI